MNATSSHTNDSRSSIPRDLELTILMPCLNEAETLETCINKASAWMSSRGVHGEILVADNGSSDGSQEIALRLGARVVDVPTRGYGAALSAGIKAARGRFTIMGDADDSYDFLSLDPFVARLREGWHLVMGNRFAGGIAPRAMPPLHRYLGNPILSTLGNTLFPSPVGDFHCGLRGFDTAAVEALELRTTGMEFASEMVVRATLAGLRIAEVPTRLVPDGRRRPPHLRSWRDGWRHLKFLLMYSPSWLFFYPGLFLTVLGLAGVVMLSGSERTVGPVTLGIHTLLYSSLAVIVGFEGMEFARFLKYLGTRSGELPADPLFNAFETFATLERTLVFGLLLLVGGLGASVYALILWSRAEFGALSPVSVMRVTIPAVTAMILGIQSFFSGFFMYALRFGPGYSGKPAGRAGDNVRIDGQTGGPS
jgi:glycosyltransferase involved in cell wall biosynthesis